MTTKGATSSELDTRNKVAGFGRETESEFHHTWWWAPARAIEHHPLVAVAIVATIVGAGHAIWIITHRHLGAFDPDEAGYIASALRIQRSIDPLHPFRFVSAVAGAGNGPLVPLLALPLLVVGPRSPLTVMMVQPVLLVFICVAVAGATRRMTGPIAAFFTGVAFLALPSAALATQSFWLGLGATASMAGAVWALVSSERLTNRWTYTYGLAVACMLLARTMTLGFLPAVIAAGAVVAGRNRKSWRGLAKAVAVVAVVAGPWYALQYQSIFGYLFDYGYGERAGLFGSGGPLERFGFRVDRISADALYFLGLTILIAVVVGVATILWRWYRHDETPRGLREFAALGTAVVLGLAALVSTSNNGVWFELPLTALVVVLIGALASHTWLPLRTFLAAQVVAQGAVVIAVTWWLVAPTAGITAHYEYGFQEYDVRYEQGRRNEQPAAARDWWDLSESVETAMARLEGLAGNPLIFTVSGNMQLFNSNTLSLAGELDGWGPRIRIPDTTVGAADRALDLTPTTAISRGGSTERVLIIALHGQILFTPDAKVAEFHDQALSAGWQPVTDFDMPDGGQVFILRHRKAS